MLLAKEVTRAEHVLERLRSREDAGLIVAGA